MTGWMATVDSREKRCRRHHVLPRKLKTNGVVVALATCVKGIRVFDEYVPPNCQVRH